MILKELMLFLKCLLRRKTGICDVTIVRRYDSPTGTIGELYVNGRQLGMTCDRFSGGIELFHHPLKVGFNCLKTSWLVIKQGDFTQLTPEEECFVGSQEPSENADIMRKLIKAVSPFKELRLTVLNRFLVEK